MHNIHDENDCVDDKTTWRHCIKGHFLAPQPMLSHHAILTQSQMNLGHSDGDILDNFCTSREQPTRMHIDAVNGQDHSLTITKRSYAPGKVYDIQQNHTTTTTSVTTLTLALTHLQSAWPSSRRSLPLTSIGKGPTVANKQK